MAQPGTPFEQFVERHATSLLRTGFLLTGDVPSAEDLLQDTLTNLYPKWSSEPQRAAVVLRYFHGMDNAEIADQLGCREATVRSLVNRRLSAMRAAAGLHPVVAEIGRTS
jgi:DNA-directed RNA polymerase specialized sigma24 family protein